VLDAPYLQSLGTFDIVYSWGVLHHTGDIWRALGNTTALVGAGGQLFIAIYNDQGSASRRWLTIKRMYNQAGLPLRLALILGVQLYWECRGLVGRILRFENPLPFNTWREKKRDRGMSAWHDLVDWVGGYPFEVAKPEEVFAFCRTRGFTLQRLKTAGGGLGNNQFVFVRKAV
jgi:2-polyprenyl-6-hydroxyphenyl methylase/3-demethylubiquinone-9 3-methyltransferase